MEKVLTFLDGKKAIIGGAINVLNAYFVASGVYDSNVGTMIAGLVLILTGVGVQATNNVLGKANRSK